MKILKIWPEYFEAQIKKIKQFEIRKGDFKVGERILLKEWFPRSLTFSERKIIVEITYITEFGQVDGNKVLGTKIISMEGL
jgi:uncharacterized alpha-E superfamily protein